MVAHPAEMRLNYVRDGLDEVDVAADPIAQFARWFAEACDCGVAEANAMTLATASADGIPAARIVLMKGFDERGFVFYSNYESAKGRDLEQNPRAALTFYWPPLERQVRVSGLVERLSREDSRAYFDSRPLGSRLAASLSHQSDVVSGRDQLEDEFARLQREYGDGDVPLPDFWGGYRVVPHAIEFWQGRPSRLHDRLRYRQVDGRWVIERLSP